MPRGIALAEHGRAADPEGAVQPLVNIAQKLAPLLRALEETGA